MTTSTSIRRHCANCGIALASDSLGGFCPKCLLQLGFQGEQERQLHIRCPQCQIPIEIIDDASIHEVTCPSCDSRFSLVGDLSATVAAETAGSLGRFELLHQVGVGAFGTVWKARDPELDRIVAVKIPRKERLSAAESEQFLREARSTAQLKHPGIVNVYEVGRQDDRIYIVSDFITGVTLADRLSAGRPSLRESAELCRLVAEALQHAHTHGVIHRDLKPSNIMLDEAGRPHVMDFGLAKRQAAEITMTIEGRILGTPAYMSPEQARGDAHQADGRSDIYSLGVMLFELLTGEKPFRGTSQMLLHQVLREEPPSPRKLNARVPRDLETVCLKCLEKEPDRRFSSAQELADELERFLDGKPIRSRPISRLQIGRRWCQRNPVVTALTAAVVISLLVGLGTTFWQWQIAKTNFEDANDARQNAVQSQQQTQTALHESESRLARVYVERGLQKLDVDPHSGLPWLVKALQTEPENSPAHQLHQLRIGLMLYELPTLLGYWPEAVAATFSQDGTKLAIATGKHVQIFELPEMKPVPVMQSAYPVHSITFTPQGDRLASVTRKESGPPWCRIWDVTTGTPTTKLLNLTEREYQLRETPTIHFTPDGERFVAVYAGMYNRWHTKMATRVFDSRTLEQVSPTFAHHSDLDIISGYHQLSPDHLRILLPRGVPADEPDVAWVDPKFPRDMNRAQQYDLMTGKAVHPPLEHPLDYYGAAVYNADGSRIATSEDGVVKIWNAEEGSLVKEFPLSADVTHANLRFHPDGTSIFIIEDRKAIWREIASGKVKQEWSHDDKFFIDPTGRYRVSRDPNGEDYIQDILRDGAEAYKLADLYRVRFSPDGSRFLLKAQGHQEAGVFVSPPDQVFRSADAQPISPPWRFSGGQVDEPFSHDGRFLLTRFDTGIWLWDLDRQRQLVDTFPPLRAGKIIDAATTGDRQRCAVLTADRMLSCWDLESGDCLYQPFRIPVPMPDQTDSNWLSMHLCETGDAVVMIGEYRDPLPEDENRQVQLIQVWSLKTQRPLFDPIVFDKSPNSWLTAARFLNDDQELIVAQHLHEAKAATNDGAEKSVATRLHQLNAVTGVALTPPPEFEHTFRLLDFTPDQKRCLVFREDDRWPVESRDPTYTPGFVQLFDTASWTPLTGPLTPEQGSARNAVLSPDGTRIVMGNAEIWDAASGERLVPALVQHQAIAEIVFHDDGQSFIALSAGGADYWDATSELRSFGIDGTSLCAPMTNTRIGEAYCAIDPQRTIAAAAGRGLRLWDTRQGTALSGVFDLDGSGNAGRVENRHRETFFAPSGNRLYIEAGDELLVVRWSNIVDSLPPDDVLAAWAGILSGHRVDQAGGSVPLTAKELAADWQKVQKMNKHSTNN